MSKQTTHKPSKKQTFVRVMAWILSILMLGSLATTIVAVLVSLLS